MATASVQKCGCIALPEDLQEKTGLYPGATYEIELTPDEEAVLIRPRTRMLPSQPGVGVRCDRLS